LVVTAERTPLYDEHVRLGAQITNFGGWLMPLQYTSIREEHRAVREAVGLFDLSHMGEIRLKDDSAAQRLLTRDLTPLRTGRVQYALLCNDDGGINDDVLVCWSSMPAIRTATSTGSARILRTARSSTSGGSGR